MDDSLLQSYREKIASLPQIRRQNTLGLLINKLQYKQGGARVVIAASKNLSETEILLLCERLDEIISILSVGRYYLSEAVKSNYNQDLLESQDLTRQIHLYTASLWYNSIIDTFYQFYSLMQSSDEITDSNYRQRLKTLRGDKKKEKVIERIENDEERKSFKSLMANLQEVNNIANTTKHRTFNIFSYGSQKNRSICIVRDFKINYDGHKLNASGDFNNCISTNTFQLDFKDSVSFIDLLLDADKEICKFLNTIVFKYFKISTKDE